VKKELEKKLFENYPGIFRQKDLPATETCMCWGISCGDGWYNILDILCGQIQNHLKYNIKKDEGSILVEAVQVKEKFGGLRFYYHGGDEFISGLVSMAEGLAEKTCEECGSPGDQNNIGWVRTLCKSCRDSYDKIRSERWKKVQEALKNKEES
jgi:hypothetical protein